MKMPLDYDKVAFEKTCQQYRLSLVILHGSYAKGMVTARSDVDVAFLGDPVLIREKFFDITKDFAVFFGDKFDPVFLNGAEALITYEVARDGRPLYERTKGLFNSFRVAAFARYFDTKKFRLLEKHYIKSAVQN